MFQLKNALCAVVAGAAVVTAAPAAAEVVFNNPGTASACGAGCWASGGSPTDNFRTWDNFVLVQDATVTSATWRGVVYDDDVDLASLDVLSWDLGFFADDGGAPGVLLQNINLAPGDVSQTLLGTGSVGGSDVYYYEFAAKLTGGFTAAAGTTYWFSPFTNQNTYLPVFAWSGSSGGTTYQEHVSGQTFTRSNNRAFSLAVPEPQTWGLMILGFGAVGSVVRARRRTAFA